MHAVEVEATMSETVLELRWSDARGSGSCRFDRLAGARPEWLGDAEELLAGTDRRREGAVLDAVARWADDAGVELGIWTDGEVVEVLSGS